MAGSILSIEDATAGSVTMTAPFNRRTGRHVLGKVRTVQYSTVQYSTVQYRKKRAGAGQGDTTLPLQDCRSHANLA